MKMKSDAHVQRSIQRSTRTVEQLSGMLRKRDALAAELSALDARIEQTERQLDALRNARR